MLRLALIDSDDAIVRHARIARRLRNARFTIVVVSDRPKARATTDSLGAEICIDSFDSLLAEHSDDFDAVLLPSAIVIGERGCERAAEAGKHVLVESPFAISKNAASQIIAACRSASVRLMVGQSLRFSPALRTVMENLDAGRLGEPGLLRIHRWNAVAGTLRVPSAAANGVCSLLLQLGGEIDLACWLFGRRPSAVYAVGSGELGYVQLHLGFAGGGMAVIDHSERLPPGDGYFSLSLIGSTGAAYADDHHNMQLLYGGGHPASLKTGEADLQSLAQLQEFIDAIEQDREPAITGTDGLRAIEVAEAAAAALTTGEAVHMPEERLS